MRRRLRKLLRRSLPKARLRAARASARARCTAPGPKTLQADAVGADSSGRDSARTPLYPAPLPPRARSSAGFTLVESLLVVALIGVLSAIAYPKYNSYRDRARAFQAVQDINAMSALVKNRWNDARAYPESLDEMQLDGRLDPWGSPYAYYNVESNGKGHARKDKALNPINTDFDLYSLGPDKKTKPQISQKDSVDDVIRASNGAFIGTASSF